MASSSSSSLLRIWDVFTSFHGPDVRKTFLSHLRTQFNKNGIKMFDDNGIERSEIIGPALKRAIRESRICIVVLSKKYASSSWCLDELLEILKCNEGQIVMTVFYGVDPSDVRKQAGDFGIAFNETCACKTEEERSKWSQALTDVSNIAGEDFQNWENEAKMIEKIARDVSDKLNFTPSRDFEGMVGLEAHLRKVESLLDLDNDGVKVVGISGPAGIGKSTIARALLHSRLSSSFPLSCFMDNLRGSFHNGFDEYRLNLLLQEKLLSNILNLNGITICHLGIIKDRLHDQKVLIILDDVEHLDQLEALANIGWFGPGSRVIVTTENKGILQQHGINDNDIYHVGFPSECEALMIFCLSAFRQTSPPDGFKKLANEVVWICGKLPLGLKVLGSLLRGKSHADWTDELPRLKDCLDGRIESVLKVGYESLHEKDQALFLFIAVFFNHKHVDHVTSMLANTNLDVRLGLKNLTTRHLIHDERSIVVMHHLLRVMARQVISKQKRRKCQILVDAQQIRYVLENAKVNNGSIIGVSFDVAESNNLKIDARAFDRLYNLLFLKVYNTWHSQHKQLHIPEDMEFPSRLRLLHWEAYPKKSLPLRFYPENLVELKMPKSQLEKLWEGTQLLPNLKTIFLSGSSRLKELPDLSNATNLESLELNNCTALVELPDLSNATNLESLKLHHCTALVELPSSISNLNKLYVLGISYCRSLEVIPRLTNLSYYITHIIMNGCSRLSSFPDLPAKIRSVEVTGTAIEELPASLTYYSRLEVVDLSENANLKAFLTDLPMSVGVLHLKNSGIERITDSIKGLHNLYTLDITRCRKLVSLPELPCSLIYLDANNCESLERVSGPFNTPNAGLFDFSNCFKLDRQARQKIIQGSYVRGWAILPGRKVPAKFNHRATGNSLTIPYSAFTTFKVCLVISPSHQQAGYWIALLCRCIVIGDSVSITNKEFFKETHLQTEHLCIFDIDLPFIDPSEVRRKIVLEFSTDELVDPDFEIIECGVQILTDETNRSRKRKMTSATKKKKKKKKKKSEILVKKMKEIQRAGFKKKKKRKLNHMSYHFSRSFGIASVLWGRRRPTRLNSYRI